MIESEKKERLALKWKKQLADNRWLASLKRQREHAPPLLPFEVYRGFDYPVGYNTNTRNSIRRRDNYVCYICKVIGTNKTLQVHHINYDKTDCKESNLITLCPSCHAKTNHKRRKWFILFMENRLT